MKKEILSLVLLASASLAWGEVKLPGWLTSHAVLQQERKLHLKASARPKSQVKIDLGWSSERLTTRADKDGWFEVDIDVPKAGGPYTLTFDDGRKNVLEDVMVGEVWMCSGQSNMEMPVKGWGRIRDYEREVANANHPLIRLFQTKQTIGLVPQTEVPLGHTGGWAVCSPKMVEEFSATAYFFARTLSERLGVAVGVVNSSWGGTPAESWTSHEALQGVTGFEDMLKKIKAVGDDEAKISAFATEALNQWNADFSRSDKGIRDGDVRRPAWNDTEEGWRTMTLPAAWESAGMSEFDGIMWFRRVVDIPADLAGKDIALRLGMIDDEDKTYWNGEMVAEGYGFNQQRKYTIPGRLVKAGRNIVMVRVSDTGGDGGITGNASDMNLADGRISLAGPWQYRVGANLADMPIRPVSPTNSWWPTGLFNGMIHPFLSMPVRGTIWYQGCANVGHADQYEPLFQTLIHDWKSRFGGEHPFYFVQLANYLQRRDVQPDSPWAALREAQRRALQIEGTGMAANIDIGEANDIHPKNKQEVGRRLALLALSRTYGKPDPCQAMEYERMSVAGDKAVIAFHHVQGSEPLAANTDIKGFTIAGPDLRWHVAKARTLSDHSVEVFSPEVAIPIAVRYGWADNPECTLRSVGGFPVSPFRTDN